MIQKCLSQTLEMLLSKFKKSMLDKTDLVLDYKIIFGPHDHTWSSVTRVDTCQLIYSEFGVSTHVKMQNELE